MRLQTFIIPALLLSCPLLAQEEEPGRRIEAGPSFLEALQKRDSVLVLDQFNYGLELKGIPEGTPIGLPSLDEEKKENTLQSAKMLVLSDWQLDSVKVSSRKDTVARYDIKAYFKITPLVPGDFELYPLEAVVGKDTLVFIRQTLHVTEPSIDIETFEPHDIKPQIAFPYTFREIAPYLAGLILFGLLVWLLVWWIKNRQKKAQEKLDTEPAHIKALRKLDKYRTDKYWDPKYQKTFYSGVTDILREYIASRYEIGAMEMTTAEIFAGLKGSDIPQDLYQEMKDLFERADFVKFAKYLAPDEDNAKVLPGAVRFVTTTYQSTLEQEIPGQAGNDVKVGKDEK